MSEAVSKLFAVEAEKWEERYQQRYFKDRREVLERWLNEIRRHPGSRALDLGCGTFPMEAVFRRHELSAVGLDASKEMVDCARALGRDAQHYSGSALPFGDATFDCVILFNVLEFIENPRAFIGEISRVSRPDGRFLMTFTNFSGLFRRTVRSLKSLVTGKPHREPTFLLNRFRYADVEGMLREAGFGSVRIFHYSWPWAYDNVFTYLPDFAVELFLRNRFFADCVYVEARKN